ncbi:hypothetical protein AMTRI_Chr03g141040 [Amborella trichopoda]|uniref:galactinol--sucrose galactosyltransferase n=1 Tax=Amborella trichopoda TaxID=13333 RepID=W1NYE5_AMBTC|nr:probable galactinol--sucrose galactosyltransferase 5 [Amborella trichopoda]ERN02642.1 hypothetical protein AMTR_s00085p00038660 [Amborella trichopoda]|eukprot:XP_006840967.1 probable galactinol--sucrose galactosyltransferase 5 [Amborella trichopoda]
MAPSLIKGTPDALAAFPDNKHAVTLHGGEFSVSGHTFLTEVPPNVVLTPYHSLCSEKGIEKAGVFVGFDAEEPKSWHAAPIGKLRGIRFMSIFRFKVWWTTHWIGDKGKDMEHETQLVILDRSHPSCSACSCSSRPYVLLLPLIEKEFRAALQPGEDDNVDLCVESGSRQVKASCFRSSLFIQAGDDPFDLVRDAMKAVRLHLGTFRLLEEKTPPGIIDKFGWCTWDAFYLNVHPEGVWEGVEGLVEGGCPPGLVLIDDGWQSICHDDDPITDQEGMNRTAAGEQMPCRLIKFQENYKFRDYESKKNPDDVGMGAFIKDLKGEFKSVEHVYVWHALCGYWGGIRPEVPGLPGSRIIAPKLTPGLEMTMEDLAVDKIVNNGVGLVPPQRAHELYEGLHSHLASVGIDGVKVDVIHLLEMLCEDYGGRVELGKAYYKAISDSVERHFKGNGVIASMEHCNDFMFLGTQTISLGRVGDDFWCTDPSGDPNGTFWLQGCHMVHCAYNSLWMGQFIHPDWDMFQSTHPCATFHAASRAISGGPIYVSDSVGKHNLELIKTLALPDGSILRCDYFALPTRDCLFEDPLHNGRTMLKIWNLNKYTGVLGAFNCQGGGWCRESRRNTCASEFSHAVKSTTNPLEVEWKKGKYPINIDGVDLFAVYLYTAKKLITLKPDENTELALEPFNFELFTVSPVKLLFNGGSMVNFAPIGLVNMLNTGGAILSMIYEETPKIQVKMKVKGRGEMRVYSSVEPEACLLNGKEVGFLYEEEMIVVQVPWPEALGGISELEYIF